MARCQHCNKLTHSEHLNVYFNVEDMDKIHEVMSLQDWTPAYMYSQSLPSPEEIGKLKCGDIWIHFKAINKDGGQE